MTSAGAGRRHKPSAGGMIRVRLPPNFHGGQQTFVQPGRITWAVPDRKLERLNAIDRSCRISCLLGPFSLKAQVRVVHDADLTAFLAPHGCRPCVDIVSLQLWSGLSCGLG